MPWRFAISRRLPGSYGLFRRRRGRRAGSTQPSIISGAFGIFQRTFPQLRVCWRIWQRVTSRSSSSRPAPASTFRRFESFMDFKTWEEVEPPKYTIYNFPPRETRSRILLAIRRRSRSVRRCGQQAIMMKMIAQHTQTGLSANDAIAWAESELAKLYADLANTGPFLSISLQRIGSEWRTKWEISGRKLSPPLLYASARCGWRPTEFPLISVSSERFFF